MLEDYLQSKAAIVLISIVWGMGLSTLFHRTCVGNNCRVITYQGPPMTDDKFFWTYGTNQCYTRNPYVVKCQNTIFDLDSRAKK